MGAKKRRSRPLIVWIGAGLAIVSAAYVGFLIVHQDVNVKLTSADREACPFLRHDDDVVHLSQRRTEAAARAQLDRWDACDQVRGRLSSTTADRARSTLSPDRRLIVALTLALLASAMVMRRQKRWRFASWAGLVLAVTYASADLVEDWKLDHLLGPSAQWSRLLPVSASVKIGAVIAASPLFSAVVFALISGEPVDDLVSGSKPRRCHGVSRFFKRWWSRLKRPDPMDRIPRSGPPTRWAARPPKLSPASKSVAAASSPADTPPDDETCLAALRKLLCPPASSEERPPPAGHAAAVDGRPVGVCCSGGGIRSAAFSLGALQSLDEPAGEAPGERTELQAASSIYAVSGGAYTAAAWVTARTRLPLADPRPWSRLSFEEQHLRRHASYMAQGAAGKVWAVLWFLFAFAANVGLLVLTIGALALPSGWLYHFGVSPRPAASGVITLPDGGCLQRPDGTYLTAAPGQKLKLVGGAPVRATPGEVTPPPEKQATAKATATAEGPPPIVAGVAVGVATTAATSTTLTPAPATGAATATSTTATTLPAGSSVPCVAEEGTGPPDQEAADTPGRLYAAGSTIPIMAGPRLEVRLVDDPIAACPLAGGSPPPTKSSCVAGSATDEDVTSGAVLLGASRATLTLKHDAIVGPGAARPLYAACGTSPCRRFRLIRWLGHVPLASLAALALAGLALVTMRPDAKARANVHSLTKWLAIFSAAAIVVLWAVPQIVVSLSAGLHDLASWAGVGAGSGLVTIVLALFAQLGSASGKSGGSTSKVGERLGKAAARLRPLLVRLAAMLVGPALVVGLAIAFVARGAHPVFEPAQLALGIVLVGWFAILGTCGDLNRFSLHPYYRDHLSSAFAIDRTTGDVCDDMLASLPADSGPSLVLCAAANLADDRITAPGRPVTSWRFSQQQIGSDAIASAVHVGYYEPGGIPDRFAELQSVWTAVAVSGAAFSPAMGKMTRHERFLMALGNLRLGVWYPNPRYLAAPGDQGAQPFDRTWYEWHHPRPWYFFKEALGLHRLSDPWVYVTDGGHYENLGLVEMLHTERPREVYCFDAAGDSTSTFGTLADAMRLARESYGIEITFDPANLKADKDGVSKVGLGAGTVSFPPTDDDPDPADGWIVLAKLTVPRTAPFDIVDLARTIPSFPANNTADQLYTDQKFEAYRALGHWLGEGAVAAGRRLRFLTRLPQYSVPDAVAIVNAELLAAVPKTAAGGDPGGT